MKSKKLFGILVVITWSGLLQAGSSEQEHATITVSPDEKLGLAVAENDAGKVKKLLENTELSFERLPINLINASVTGKDEIVKELLRIRGDEIDVSDASKALMRVVSRHTDKIYKQMSEQGRRNLTESHVKIMQLILDKKGREIPSSELRDMYQEGMKINDASRRPIIEVLTNKMRKLGVEWN